MSTQLTIRAPRRPRRPVLEAVIQQPSRSSRRRRRRKRGGELISQGLPLYNQGTLIRSYIDTLNDPFACPPVRLGFETLVPTSIWTAYYRSTFALAADGSGTIVLYPSLGSTNAPIMLNNGTSGVTTGWTSAAFSNTATLQQAMFEARVISGGIRAVPLIAATSSPGIVYTGTIPSTAFASISGVSSTSGMIQQPGLRMGCGSLGALALTRPVDPSSFIFSSQIVTNANTAITSSVSVPVVAFTNFPASSQVSIEVVLNFEGILGYQSNSAALEGMPEGNSSDSLANYFPSIERMWNSIKGYISDPGVVDNMAQAVARTGSFVANNSRALISGFQIGRHIMNARHSVRNDYFGIPRANRVIIEEVN